MRRWLAVPITLVVLSAGGFGASLALTAPGDVHCNTATATASTPDHTVGVDGAPVSTIPGDTSSAVAQACITEPDPITVTVTTTAPPPPVTDTIAYPHNASHLAFNFGDGSQAAHFQLNVLRGCNPHVADLSYALNPQQVNYIVPGKLISPDGIAPAPNCGASGVDFAVSYGAYSTMTSPTVSPYPGIGTIRAYDNTACPGGDQACLVSNARMPNNLDWGNAAGIDTPTWAAKLRAHFYRQQLSTGPHPGVHGIWGDNFVWAEPFLDDNHEGTDTAWDDGSIRNAITLNSLLPPRTLQGANGAGLSCAFGDTYTGTVPGADCSRAGDTFLYEGVGGYVNVHNPTRVDAIIAQYGRWLNSTADDGNPKRALWNVYGTVGTNNVGHILTAQDQRINLAFASIAGAYLWAVNGASWDTTAIPGTASGANMAIPEMGDTTAFPRGWLGQPTSAPQMLASGRWKRTFSGGTVYANAVNSAWVVDGLTVPAWDGKLVAAGAPTPPPPPPPPGVIQVPCGANIASVVATAAPSSTLQLGSCAYPNQDFNTTNPVTVQGNGSATTVGDLDAHGAQNITFKDFAARDMFWVPLNGSSGGRLTGSMVVDNVDFTAGGIFLRGCQTCTFRNGESGNTHDAYSQTIGAYSFADRSRNVLVDNWLFHDMDRTANPAGHMECLFIQESDGVTVQNSTFTRCAIMDVFISPIVSSNAPTNITFRGNTFNTPTERGGGAVVVNPDPATSTSGFCAQGNNWVDRFLLENDSATVTGYVWAPDNTGAAPALLEPTGGFVFGAC